MADQTQTNPKILAALTKLDHKNDDHWTPDGLPKLGIIQKLASDNTIKLRDIQVVGYTRNPPADKPVLVPVKPVEAAPIVAAPQASDDDFSATDPVEHTGADVNGAAADPAATQTEPPEPESEYMTEGEVHEILQQRVAEAEQGLKDARTKQAEGQREEGTALQALRDAKAEYNATFPPMTDAENRKQYIASENAKRAERAGHGAPSRVDAAMTRSNSRGWRRPVRGVTGADGHLIKNADGSVAMPRPMQSRPVRAAVPSNMGGR